MKGRELQRLVQEDLTFEWDSLELAGTLYLPESDYPSPAVLMMQGSGPADRDSDGYFPPIRDAFLELGIATYSFDKPGIGESSGDWRDYALDGRARQSMAALSRMHSHRLIDADRVGIWGHSQGGWLAQIIASRNPDLPFAVAHSGPSITPEQQNLYGCEHTMRENGHSETEIRQALEFLDELHAAARRGDDYETVEKQLLQPARDASWYGYLTIDNAEDWKFASIFEEYDPIGALSRVRCPFLAIFGGLDPLVPAWRGAEETGRALQEAGNRDATVIVFPSGNHRMYDATTGKFCTGYLDLMMSWVGRRTLSPEEVEFN